MAAASSTRAADGRAAAPALPLAAGAAAGAVVAGDAAGVGAAASPVPLAAVVAAADPFVVSAAALGAPLMVYVSSQLKPATLTVRVLLSADWVPVKSCPVKNEPSAV